MLVPEAVPLLFPEFSFSWLYDYGNIAIGFVAYKVGFACKIFYKKLLASALSIGVLLMGIML